MLRKLFCMGLITLFATSSQAGVLASLLTANGIEDTLRASTSRVNIIDQDQSGGVTTGDVVYGFVEISQVQQDGGINAPVPPATMAALFSVEVGALGANGFNLQGVSGGNAGLGLDTLVGNGIGATDLFAIVSTTPLVNLASFVETQTTSRGFADGFTADSTVLAGTNLGETPDGLSGFSSFDLELTADLSGGGDFFLFENGGLFGIQSGGATVASQPGLPGVTNFLPVASVLPSGGAGLPSGLTSDITLDLTFVTSAAAQGFGFNGNSSFRINAVPEPGTMLSFAALGLCGLAARRRRKTA